jgi:hypothetical protein
MAYISNYLFTGINHNITFNSSLENPISYNDTFIVGSDLYFGLNLTLLNTLRNSVGQSSINPVGTEFTLTVFLCNTVESNLTFSPLKTKQYTLGPLQTNNYIYESINSILEDFSNNDQLLESMSIAEIQKLKKSFKIIFRINPTSSPVLTLSVQNGDLVQDLHIVADTMQSGPYEVVFENVDILSPDDFTDSERQAAYSANINLLGAEGMRCFYPKDITSPRPLVFCVRANAANVENYDVYLSLFASYGYFCVSLFQDVTTATNLMFDNGIYDMENANAFGINQDNFFYGAIEYSSYHQGVITIGYLDHIQKNLSKINGGKFNNKIDFTKLISMGHSRGGGAAYNVYELLLYKNIPNNLISKFNTSLTVDNLKSLICLAPNKGDVLQPFGSITTVGSVFSSDAAKSTVVPPYNPSDDGTVAGYRYVEYTRGISQGNYSLLNSSTTSKLKLNTNIPTLFLYPEYDLDTDLTTNSLYRSTNLDSFGNIINKRKLILVKKLNHNGVSTPVWYPYPYNSLYSVKGYNVPSSSGIIFNNLSSRIMYLASKSLEFIAHSVYSANLNTDVYNNPNDFSSRQKSLLECFEFTEHPIQSTIVKTIDKFDSVNFTTNTSGWTLAYGIDKTIKDQLEFLSQSGYTLAPELYSKGLLFLNDGTFGGRNSGSTYPVDLTDKLYTANGKGLLLTYDSSLTQYNVSYSYPSNLDLSSGNFIRINGAQISTAPLNAPTLNETPLKFSLKLTDSSLLTSTLSCLNYNDGIADPSSFHQSSVTHYTYSQINSTNFRLQDFKQKQPTLDLSKIKQIDLLFGSLHGTTTGTIFIDSIYAI